MSSSLLTPGTTRFPFAFALFAPRGARAQEGEGDSGAATSGAGSAGLCNLSAGPIHTFLAQGDLDGDGVYSRFEVASGFDQALDLYRAPGIYIENELE
jgi:hypothetical protein